MIAKSDLKHGAYYRGTCRNAELARWNAKLGVFMHLRLKWGREYPEAICHPDDEGVFDVFTPEAEVTAPEREIPLSL